MKQTYINFDVTENPIIAALSEHFEDLFTLAATVKSKTESTKKYYTKLKKYP